MQQSISSRPFFVLPVIGVAALAAGALLRHATPQGQPVTLIAALDTSGSVRVGQSDGSTLLGRCVASVARLVVRLDGGHDHVSVYRVDRQAQEFYDDTAPASRERFQWLLIDRTKPRAAQDGTFPAVFWGEAAQQVATTQTPVAIVYGGDADNDDLRPSAVAAMRQAAQRLAANPRVVAVVFLGASPKNWATLQDIFAPLGTRLLRQPPEAMDINPVLDRLEAARAAASPMQK